MSSTARRAFCAVSIAASFAVAACGSSGGGGGGGSGTSGFTNFDLLITDEPADDLLAFRVRVNEVHLLISAGGETANLLDGPVVVELLGLQGQFMWLASEDLPEDSYSGVRLVFAPGSYDARRNDGTIVAVNATADEATLTFATALAVTDGGYEKVEVDLDLASSLSGSIAAPPITFSPQGAAQASLGSAALDEIRGIVSSVDTAAHAFVLTAFVDDDVIVPLGSVLVYLDGSTVMIEDDGDAFASSTDCLAAMVPNTTILEVHGELAGGAVTATRIEVEDNQAGGGDANLVKIEGLVIGRGPGSTLAMSIIEVEKGASIVAAASGGTVPNQLGVTWDLSTVFFLDEHDVITSASLDIGQRIKAKFPMFTSAPFTASRIQIENDVVENDAIITSTAGLPTTIVVRMEADAPAILSGQVSSTSTDVTVDVAGLAPTLDTQGAPTISLPSLLAGLRIDLGGSVAGTPPSPTVDASGIQVKAGVLADARVSFTTPAIHQFTTSFGTIDNPFGTGVSAGPQTVLISTNCVFTGDAATRDAFFALFSNLGVGQFLTVRVEGFGTGNMNQIHAYEVRAEVQP